jgi:predicted metal-dependent phosphoesterase TrpH
MTVSADLASQLLARHPHLEAERTPGRVRMDCHLHTVRSGDSVTTPEQMAMMMKAARLDVIAVTDHHSIEAAEELAARSDLRVIIGEEIRTPVGEVIGLFLTERVPYVLPLLDAAQRIRDQGGLVYVPHAFDPLRSGVGWRGLNQLADAGLLDIIEVFNAKVENQSVNDEALRSAREFGVPGAAGSDAHDPAGIGAAYVELDDFTDASGFVRALAGGSVAGHYFAHARRYLPRVGEDRQWA